MQIGSLLVWWTTYSPVESIQLAITGGMSMKKCRQALQEVANRRLPRRLMISNRTFNRYLMTNGHLDLDRLVEEHRCGRLKVRR